MTTSEQITVMENKVNIGSTVTSQKFRVDRTKIRKRRVSILQLVKAYNLNPHYVQKTTNTTKGISNLVLNPRLMLKHKRILTNKLNPPRMLRIDTSLRVPILKGFMVGVYNKLLR